MFRFCYNKHMLKGTILTTIGFFGIFWSFFAPLGMVGAKPINWVIYALLTGTFFVMTAVGLNIRSKYLKKK